jgi:hypothetical protein
MMHQLVLDNSMLISVYIVAIIKNYLKRKHFELQIEDKTDLVWKKY